MNINFVDQLNSEIQENWYLKNIGETTVDFTESYFE